MSSPNKPLILAATNMIGSPVVNAAGEDLGRIEELMIDLKYGCIAYAVLSFGGLLGFGSKLFAIPWKALDAGEDGFRLEVSKETLVSAPGFDHTEWPDVTDRAWGRGVYDYYGQEPYW